MENITSKPDVGHQFPTNILLDLQFLWKEEITEWCRANSVFNLVILGIS